MRSYVQKSVACRSRAHSEQSLVLEFHNTLLVPRAIPQHFPVRHQIGVMSRSTDGVRCTVYDGAMWMHLDNASVKIPSQLLNKSQVLMAALSVADPSARRKVTVAAPREWLQAWVGCYCNEQGSLECENINDLVNCLLVCFLPWSASAIVPDIATHAVSVFKACGVLGSATLY
jgi:hypothetical protein